MLFVSIIIAFAFTSLATDDPELPCLSEQNSPNQNIGLKIDIWYGRHQRFGHLGISQRWINIVGNVSSKDSVTECFYILNNRPAQPFQLGPDLHRLAKAGDFNLDLALTTLEEGENRLIISVISGSRQVNDTVFLQISKEAKWPIPYEVDFTVVDNLQDVIQVVDGNWNLTKEGVRTVEPYYDRVFCIGDTSWQNYEALVKLTVHDWTPSQPGPPTYNVSHFGIAMHWRGHHEDGNQPRRKWYPLGAQGEFLLKEKSDSCHWRILFDGKNPDKPPIYASGFNSIKKNRIIWVKSQVRNVENGNTVYKFKQWLDGQEEPAEWNLEGTEKGDYSSGSLCIVPHNSDVTIHQVKIDPIF
ncbi:MAG: hypothetical protein HKN76_09005 [Saprospiraceae bacterium]|nr:hypothetical protein [Saprospiraceae bacterium]